jgi:hypothetical protein
MAVELLARPTDPVPGLVVVKTLHTDEALPDVGYVGLVECYAYEGSGELVATASGVPHTYTKHIYKKHKAHTNSTKAHTQHTQTNQQTNKHTKSIHTKSIHIHRGP